MPFSSLSQVCNQQWTVVRLRTHCHRGLEKQCYSLVTRDFNLSPTHAFTLWAHPVYQLTFKKNPNPFSICREQGCIPPSLTQGWTPPNLFNSPLIRGLKCDLEGPFQRRHSGHKLDICMNCESRFTLLISHNSTGIKYLQCHWQKCSNRCWTSSEQPMKHCSAQNCNDIKEGGASQCSHLGIQANY